MTTAARASQTGLALVAIVAVPVLVAQTAQPEPKPEENKLTVRLTGPERTDAGGRLRLRAADAAPMAPTLLLSADGLDSATVNAVDSKQCARMSIRQTSNAVGGHQWCLEIRGIRDGDELSGVVTGAGDKLTLSVARRAEFFWKPFLVAITGLLVGALVLLVPRSLRTSIRSAVLEQLLDENDAAAASAQIADLRTWVGSRREKGETDDALLPIVARLVADGPNNARAHRQALANAVAVSALPRNHPALTSARDEMTRTPLATKDFVDDDGEPVAVHPASAMITLLSRLQRDHQQLQDLATDIDALKPDKHADAQEALEVAQSHFDTADSSEKADELENALGEVERRVAAARRRPIRTLVSVDRVVVDQAEHAAIRRQVLSSSTTFRSLASTANRLLTHFKGAFKVPILWVVTAFVIAVVIAWAILTLALTVYDEKPAFGKATDYWTLLAAATGSGAAGAALALLAAWDPSAPAEDA